MSANRTYSPNDPLGYEITLTRDFTAPRKLVFQAWTEEERVKQWWGPESFTNPVCKVDAVAGGMMDIHMRSPDGTVYPMTAVFEEIVAPEKIVFTSGALDEKGKLLFQILTTVLFEEVGAKTRLTLTARVVKMTSEGAHYIGGMEMGWSGSLDKLVTYVDKTQTEVMTTPDTSDREIIISRVFAAPRELVWDAMTDPTRVVKWWGPRGFTTTIEKMDVRPGGTWKHVMQGPDGTEYPNLSVFVEVVKPERIVYVHTGSKKGGPGVKFVATWTFTTVAEGRTELKLHQLYDTAADRDLIVREYGAIEGGKQTLARLAEFLGKSEEVV
jgi:uncharacterized protein YndB with AHSA1/START domain